MDLGLERQCLGLEPQGLGLGLGLATSGLGLGLGKKGLEHITGKWTIYMHRTVKVPQGRRTIKS